MCQGILNRTDDPLIEVNEIVQNEKEKKVKYNYLKQTNTKYV